MDVLQQKIVEREKTKPKITEGGLENHSVDLDTNCARASHTRKLQVLNGTCDRACVVLLHACTRCSEHGKLRYLLELIQVNQSSKYRLYNPVIKYQYSR